MENQEVNEVEKREEISHVTSDTAKEMDEADEITNMKKIEAALFIAGRFLSLQDLVMLTDVNPLMLKELIERLIEKYNTDESGIEIIVKENTWKMDVRQEHVSMINKLATGSAEFSKAEQETLAVIAYKQPVKQSVIIKIRGNKAYDHVKKFIENGLIVGKRAGHTKELRLSDDFHEYFHLRNNKIISDDHRNSEDNEEFRDLKGKELEGVSVASEGESDEDERVENKEADDKDNDEKNNNDVEDNANKETAVVEDNNVNKEENEDNNMEEVNVSEEEKEEAIEEEKSNNVESENSEEEEEK